MSNCKFCGSKLRQSRDDGAKFFACGTGTYSGGQSFRTSDCRAEELARYRDMFPIPPWDDSPITAEVCERLGYKKNEPNSNDHTHLYTMWKNKEYGEAYTEIVLLAPNTRVPQDERERYPHTTLSAGCRGPMTAGQLAFLVAARRASK